MRLRRLLRRRASFYHQTAGYVISVNRLAVRLSGTKYRGRIVNASAIHSHSSDESGSRSSVEVSGGSPTVLEVTSCVTSYSLERDERLVKHAAAERARAICHYWPLSLFRRQDIVGWNRIATLSKSASSASSFRSRFESGLGTSVSLGRVGRKAGGSNHPVNVHADYPDSNTTDDKPVGNDKSRSTAHNTDHLQPAGDNASPLRMLQQSGARTDSSLGLASRTSGCVDSVAVNTALREGSKSPVAGFQERHEHVNRLLASATARLRVLDEAAETVDAL